MKYTIPLTEHDDYNLQDFELYGNGKLIMSAPWIYELLNEVSQREQISLYHSESESHMLAILKDSGVDIHVEDTW